METKSNRWILFLFIGFFLTAGAFSGGILVDHFFLKTPSAENPIFSQGTILQSTPAAGQIQPAQTMEELFSPFWETWNIVHQRYVDQPVDDLKLMRGAISGMLASLGDPHTTYMDPDQYQELSTDLSGELEGIGAWVDTSGAYLTIISPIPGAPAEAAGLKAGDEIIAVDGKDMTGIDPSLVLKQVKGPEGTPVTLTILRKDQADPFDVTITRAKVSVPSIESKILDTNIAYIYITEFGQKTPTELRTALKTLLAQNPKGLILDLRYNPGGYLDTAISVLSEFLPEGKVILYEENGDGSRQAYLAKSGGLAEDIPLVVLVNEGSASASEITAGAIQDTKRGVIVGTTTYGKGSVQSWITLQNNQGAVKVTIARWLTPNGRQINKIGLEPDYKVEITQEDVTNKKDPQLDKAIELITQGW